MIINILLIRIAISDIKWKMKCPIKKLTLGNIWLYCWYLQFLQIIHTRNALIISFTRCIVTFLPEWFALATSICLRVLLFIYIYIILVYLYIVFICLIICYWFIRMYNLTTTICILNDIECNSKIENKQTFLSLSSLYLTWKYIYISNVIDIYSETYSYLLTIQGICK